MAKQLINIGNAANDNTGDTIRVGFSKVNSNLNELYDAKATTGAAKFTTPAGTFCASPTVPVTTTINLDTSDAVNGGVCGVYFKGTNLAFSGGTVVIQTGEIVDNELCLVWLVYDKTNNCFIANVQGGATGSTPTPGISFTAPTITVTDPGGISFTAPTITVTDV